MLREEKVFADVKQNLEERISHEPLGVIANISAWNYPYFVGANVFVPALLAGNAVLYKPSEFATLTGQAYRRSAARAGVPRRCLHSRIRWRRDRCGAAAAAGRRRFLHRLVRDRRQDRRGGGPPDDQGPARARRQGPRLCLRRRRRRRPRPRGLPTALSTTPGSRAARSNASTCTRSIHDAFVEAFVAEVNGYQIGDPLDDKTYIGADHATGATRCAAKASDGRQTAQGATLLPGGNVIKRKGNWFEPTVLTDVDHRMSVMRDESFGPIIGIQKVKDDAEAVLHDERQRIRPDRRRLHAGREAGAQDPVEK